MSKKFKTRSAKYKSAIFGIVAVAASFAMFASACADTTTNEEEDTNTSTKVDEQVLKNGNFEFFSDNDGTYIIGTPDNWSSATGSSATASDSASGVIGTTAEDWSKLTDPELPQKLWDNAALETDDENYVNYNAMPEDLPFKDPASAILENEDDDEDDQTDDYYIAAGAEYIANPNTHNYRWVEDESGNKVLYDAEGNQVTYYTDEDGNYYTSSDLSADSAIESNVLMIHNYVDDDKQGTETYYSSSTTLTLEANTAAKISVWVKTSDLYYGGNNDARTEVKDQRGAYIQLAQTVGGTSLENFRIENINTDVLNPYDEESGTWEKGNNGWVQYTLYVSACDYAETTITLTVGLGRSSVYTLEGYAFFDDITYEKYLNIGEMVDAAGGEETFNGQVAGTPSTTCTLMSEADEKIFPVDKAIYNQLPSPVEQYSNNYYYYIDLATSASQTASGQRDNVILSDDNLKVDLTVDDDGYVSSRGNGSATYSGLTKPQSNQTTYLNKDLNINVADDIIAKLEIDSSWTWSLESRYGAVLEDELKTAAELPATDGTADVLLMLSARGAAYEAVISDPSFTFSEGDSGYKIVSFWIKTDELTDANTVTVTARQTGDSENEASFQVDSTTVDPVTINDTEDVYNGWVQCFALVSCSEDLIGSESFELVINYGATTIKSTTSSDYYGGWYAIANISVLSVDETAFGYADTETRAAALSITEEASDSTNIDDPLYSGQIDSEIAVPSSYKGVNGGSASVQNVPVEVSDYDRVNNYDLAGLINKDNFDAYKTAYSHLLDQVENSTILDALFGENATWDTAVGATVTQPLLIVNTARTFAERTAVYNYGYIGSDSSVSADSYLAISVRVKVSEGAKATVYLVDTATKQPLSFNTPAYTFWYDNDGNVLKGEPDEDWTREQQRANIAYTLRDDGLYEDENGNLYANLYNLAHEYFDERANYFDAQGNAVAFDNLVEGEIYYADAQKTAYAPHYLVTDDGDRVYSYVSGVDGGVVYNYFVDGEVDTERQIKAFDTNVAVPRYTGGESNPYALTVDAIANPEIAGKWVTVNFFVHSGSVEKSYRLELWSGSRDEQTSEGVLDGSYVMFDYSAVSLDEDTYSSLISHYSGNIIEAYRNALRAADSSIVFDSNDENIAYYEALAAEKGVDVNLYNYIAEYYTYTLYDSTSYIPFNADTAEEGESGYNYAYSDYSEELAVLKVEDMLRYDAEGNATVSGSPLVNMFIDYSTTDKDISMTNSSDVTDDEEDTTTTPADTTNIWLLVSSIVMVVAILIAIAVLLLRDLRKKVKARPQAGKNTYNYKKNRRYVRTYVKEHGETTVRDENEGGETTDGQTDTPAEEQPQANVEETDGNAGEAESESSEEGNADGPADDGDGSDNN